MNKLKQLTIVLLLLAVTFGLIPALIMAQEGAACDADVIVQGFINKAPLELTKG